MKSLRESLFLPRCKAVSGLLVLALAVSGRGASAQSSLNSLESLSAETVAQQTGYGHYLDVQVVNDNSTVASSVTKAFSGKDSNNTDKTMTFTSTSVSQSDYGSLHVKTTASLANSYYNANNPAYVAPDGSINDPNGSPTLLNGLGRAFFSDTLQYGGALQSGYKARYIFHVDGTNSGSGAYVELTVTADSNPSENFLTFNTGAINMDWATSEYDVNGITPQKINVYFQSGVGFNTKNSTDGMDYTGTADFSSTLTLSAIELVDQNGNLASGYTVTSASGTRYTTIQGSVVPEPGSLALCVGMGVFGAGVMRRRSKRQAAERLHQ